MAENQTRRQRKLCTPAPLPEGLGADGQRTLIPLIMSEASGCEGREKHLAVSSTSLSRERWAGTGGLGGGGRKESGCKTAQPLGTLPRPGWSQQCGVIADFQYAIRPKTTYEAFLQCKSHVLIENRHLLQRGVLSEAVRARTQKTDTSRATRDNSSLVILSALTKLREVLF